MKLKRLVTLGLSMVMVTACITGCGSDANSSKKEASGNTSNISVVSREEGSGTRGAFVELFGVEEKNANGEKVDNTTPDAIITSSTSVVMTTVEKDPNAIGYISLGSLNDTVKAVKIDGAEATVDNIKSNTYKIARPFNICTNAKLSDAEKDFQGFILSADGQKVIEDNGYIKSSESGAYQSNGAKGKVVVAGSSSVTPVMEKIKEAYEKVNKDVTIEIQESDSTTGITAASDGTCDIGMASRDLKDEELSKGLTQTKIAMDGIAVVVNKESKIDELSAEQVKAIYKGETTTWDEVSK